MANHNPTIHIPEGYPEDPFLKELFKKIESTDEHFIITGKAGTGKSTFLQYLAQNTRKNMLVAAFSGIAAINIGGVTIHSLFQFPLKPLLPGDDSVEEFRDGSYKKRLLKKADTIVIDEFSMLRSDIFQAVDLSLRINTGNRLMPFGGKQIILIGDMFQLPPVVQNDPVEKEIFSETYDSEYFFDAPVFREADFNFIELFKVYRQEEQQFVQLLNEIRTCTIGPRELAKLNSRYRPDYLPDQDDYVVTLTTTNNVARTENRRRLELLDSPRRYFEAKIEGEFPSDRFPTDEILELREGAQVIFIKNDLNGRRWVNGTIAKVDFVDRECIVVRMEDGEQHELEKETWHNIRYTYNKRKNRIEEEVIGTFVQYPVKLAWAMTIHKSQGLTFDKVILDLGRGAFVNGQLYVGLSRCRTFDGLILKKKITRRDIIKDPRLMEFYRYHKTRRIRSENILDIGNQAN